MSGGEVSGFKEPSIAEAYLMMLTSRIIGGYYRKYIESLHLQGNEKVLEYGSGSGAASKYLVRALPDGQLTCVDISRVWMRFVKRAVGKFQNVDFVREDMAEMVIMDEAYDCAFVHFVLHDVPQPQRAGKVKFLARKLKKGGKVYVREPTGAKHGMPAAEVRELMAAAGLRETGCGTGKSPEGWPTFHGVYVK